LRAVYTIGHGVGLVLPPTAIRPFGTWYIPSIPQGSPYSGTSWYIDSSFDRERQQVIGTRFLELVRDEPWQKSNPHWDVAVIDRDLVDGLADRRDAGRGEFTLGTAIPELATVLSVYRLRGLVRPEQRELALRRLVLHQFGQVLGLPSASREADVERIGARRYCTNSCVMRRARTVEQLVRAAELEGRDQLRLCDRCRRDVVELIARRSITSN
jgi:hypothetical protein